MFYLRVLKTSLEISLLTLNRVYNNCTVMLQLSSAVVETYKEAKDVETKYNLYGDYTLEWLLLFYYYCYYNIYYTSTYIIDEYG